MFDLDDDDFEFDEEDFDKICTGKTLEKSSKFSSIEIAETEKGERKTDQSALEQFNEDDDEMLLSVIELGSSSKGNDPGMSKQNAISDKPSHETPHSERSRAGTSTRKPDLESSLPSTPAIKSAIFSPPNQPARSFTPIVCQRKFPGPAGLLPKRTSSAFSNSHSSTLTDINFDDCSSLQKTVCSQNSNASFEAGPWQHLTKEFGQIKKDDCLLNNFTVAWVKRKAMARQFVKHRVPFLAALLISLDCSLLEKSSGPVVLLKDPTGEIQGTLDREAWDKFGPYLSIGSVLIFRQVGIFSAGISNAQQYLNITAKCIAAIYPADSSPKVEVLPVTNKEVAEKIAEWKKISQQSTVDSPLVRNSVQNNTPRSLFTGSGAQQLKRSSCPSEPASKRPCYESTNFRRNVPSPFPLSSNKSTNNSGAKSTNSTSRISLDDPRPPQVSNSTPKVQNTIKNSYPTNQPKICGGQNIIPKLNNSVCNNSPAIIKDPNVPESKVPVSSASKISNDDLSVLTSVLEGIDADMFDDF